MSSNLGLTTYFTGVPCRYSHMARRITASGMCIDCQKIIGRLQRIKNPNQRLMEGVRQRSRQFGVEVTITKDDLVVGESCPCCGNAFKRNMTLAKAQWSPRS